jgi:hypothetical protein
VNRPSSCWLISLLVLAVGVTHARSAEPILDRELDFGTLRVVELDDFDPPPPEADPPPFIEYHEETGEGALAVERPQQTAAALLARLPGDPADMSGRQFVLAVVELTRQSLDVPLLAPQLDAYTLEQLLASRRGICRHQARVAEVAFGLLQPLCPAARDIRVVAYGDRFTHSWLRATAAVPSPDGWSVLETHIDVAAGRDAGGRSHLDLATGEMADRFPLRGMILMDAGQVEPAVSAWMDYVNAPTCPRRGAALVGLLTALVERGVHAEAAGLVAPTLAALDADEAAMRLRDTGVTPEQLAELRRTAFEAVRELHRVSAGLDRAAPEATACDEAITAQRRLRDDLVAFTTAVDDALARADLAHADGLWSAHREKPGEGIWGWDAAYADALRRGAMAARRVRQDDLALAMTARRYELRPDDPHVGVQLANAALLRIQDHERGAPVALDVVREIAPSLPTGVPETHLVRAHLASLDGDEPEAAVQWRALLAACDAIPTASAREDLFALHALVSLQHAARATADADGVRDLAAETLPRLRDTSALTLTPEQHENLAVLWWDLGITLTIVDRDPALAVRIWEAFVAWSPGDARARYGLARGLVQRAQHELAAGDVSANPEVAATTARAAIDALEFAVTLDVPVPEAQSYLRLAWFNLATVFESHGRSEDSLEIAYALREALPEEPGGDVLAARTLGLMAANAHEHDGCEEAGRWLDLGDRHLAAATHPLPDHLRASAAVAHHSLAVGAANCGDRHRAAGFVQMGLERFPEDAGLRSLQEQLSGPTP